MTSISPSPPATKELYHLFGFPIAHSASPALHNYLFVRLGLERTYKLTPTTRISRHMRSLCHAKDFGGASVTMPLKVTVACMLDRVTDEARAIGAVNTLVLEHDNHGRKQLTGTNTDWLGVRNAILYHLAPTLLVDPNAALMPSGTAGLVIGGGGAARAAVYALADIKCSPIYLVGRDASELSALVTQFPHILCVPVLDPTHAINVKIAIGCVPAIRPVTTEEVAADACTRAIFSTPEGTICNDGSRRIFLDMCYKPRTTPLMLHAASAGWTTVSGIEAMLEQGFAQARMWLAKSVDPQSCVGLIPYEIEEGARKLIRAMPDIVVGVGEESSVSDDEGDEDVE